MQAELDGLSLFPLKIPFGKIRATDLRQDYQRVNQQILQLKAGSKAVKGRGYELELTEVSNQSYGKQYLPGRIYIPTQQDFLGLIGMTKSFQNFLTDEELIHNSLPGLDSWVRQYPLKVVEYAGKWNDLIKVCLYMAKHPRPNVYIRELPIEVHTKFIEQHKGILYELFEMLLTPDAIDQRYSGIGNFNFEQRFGLRYDTGQIRFRVLDDALRVHPLLSDMSLTPEEFASMSIPCEKVFIVENNMPFLTFPKMNNAIVIWGKGRAVGALQVLNWLHEKSVYYWGDLDAQGFEILHQIRSYFPHTISLLMDRKTFEAYEEFTVPGTKAATQFLSCLTPGENELYNWLSTHNLRLEQERIPQTVLNACLADEFKKPNALNPL